jgi:hypothetical protein
MDMIDAADERISLLLMSGAAPRYALTAILQLDGN